jgi:hypothetical protein
MFIDAFDGHFRGSCAVASLKQHDVEEPARVGGEHFRGALSLRPH